MKMLLSRFPIHLPSSCLKSIHIKVTPTNSKAHLMNEFFWIYMILSATWSKHDEQFRRIVPYQLCKLWTYQIVLIKMMNQMKVLEQIRFIYSAIFGRSLYHTKIDWALIFFFGQTIAYFCTNQQYLPSSYRWIAYAWSWEDWNE